MPSNSSARVPVTLGRRPPSRPGRPRRAPCAPPATVASFRPVHAQPAASETPPAPTGVAGIAPHYAGYFACFNTGRYYEAHDVLEALWLTVRGRPVADFYKALIQLAGVFVHLEKGRPQPAIRLLRRAGELLEPFGDRHAGLDLPPVHALRRDWLARLESAPDPAAVWGSVPPPHLVPPGPDGPAPCR